MTTYICKCGAIQRKSTNADNTGNRDTENCQGCPYLLPYGALENIDGKGWQLNPKGYECRMSQSLEYGSCFSGSVTDKCTCYVSSLDYDFLESISSWVKETYPAGELSGGFSRENIRPTDFSSNGRYRYGICCSQNKAGMAAKAALLERFFHPDGSRKDMTPEEEKAKILADIENGKAAAQGDATRLIEPFEEEQPYAASTFCLCASCTCTDCHEECYGNCHCCGNPVDSCNSYQTGGEKRLTVHKETAPEAQANPAPAFDYSGLDEQTTTRLQNLERRALECKQRYVLDMMEIVYEAHMELCGAVVARCDNGQFNQKEATFRAWCASIGVGKDTAYRLLQVQALMDNSSPEEQEVLANAPAKLLYAAARPSAPAELVEQVKSGDITTHKQYQELLAELRAKDETIKAKDVALQEKDAVLQEKDAALQQARQTADLAQTTANIYEAQKKGAEEQCLALIDENEAQAARIAELESRPIEMAVQPPSEEQLAAIRQQADEEARQKYSRLVEATARDRKELQAHADALSAQIRALKQEARMPGMDTVYPMCRDYARSIGTFQSTFLMVGAGLDQKDFRDCAHELMDAAQELCCILQATMDDRDRTTTKEDDLF